MCVRSHQQLRYRRYSAYLMLRVSIAFMAAVSLFFAAPRVYSDALNQAHELRFETVAMEFHALEGDHIGAINSIIQDSQGFMWFGGENGLVRYDGRQFKLYQSNGSDQHSISNNDVRDLLLDRDGVLWIATRKGLNRYNTAKDHFEPIFVAPGQGAKPPLSLSDNYVTSLAVGNDNQLYVGTGLGLTVIAQDRNRSEHYYASLKYDHDLVESVSVADDGRVLVGTFTHGLHILDTDNKHYAPYPLPEKHKHHMQARMVADILQDDQKRIWLSSVIKPLMRIDPDGEVTLFEHDPERKDTIGSNANWKLFQDRTGQIWVATSNAGIALFNEQTETFTNITHNPYQRNALASDQVRSLYEDNVGDIWLGTFTSEINYLNRSAAAFKHYYFRPDINSLSNDGVMSIVQTAPNAIWIGTEKGFNKFNPKTETFTGYTRESTDGELRADAILSIEEDRHGTLWLGTTMDGLNTFDPATAQFSQKGRAQSPLSFGQDSFVWDVLIDEKNIWTGTLLGGLLKQDLQGNKIRSYGPTDTPDDALLSVFVSHLAKGANGNLLIGTLEGLSALDIESDTIAHLIKPENPDEESGAYRVTALYRDSQDRIWVGLQGRGVWVLDAEYRLLKSIGPNEGLASSFISSFIEDRHGHIWVATQNGIARLDAKDYSIRAFQTQHGLISNSHNRDATLEDTEGNLYFGSTDGITVFHPDQIHPPPPPSKVVISDLSINGIHVNDYNSNSPLQQAMSKTRSLELSHKQTSFGFGFSLLNYRAARYNRYSHYLEGLDQGWSELSADHSAYYNNVPPGRYRFYVKGQDSTGQWSENNVAVDITVLPPPWLTWWAYLLYGLLLTATVWQAINHQRKKLELEKEKSLNAELVKVAKLKNTFLANTSHELRTPLNGIIGISEYLTDYSLEKNDEHLEAHLGKLTSSGKRLLNLINDVLDFSKLESDTLVLRKEPVNILQLTDDVIAIAELNQQEKALTINNHLLANAPYVYADPNRLRQIMLNLLSNAIKYTDHGQITISNTLSDDSMAVSIADTGTGMGETELNTVFDVFNQSLSEFGKEQGGIGLGLAITKQLIALHGGEINVSSALARGSVFTFTLPLAKPGSLSNTASQTPNKSCSTGLDKLPEPCPMSHRQTVLVVDDDTVNRMVMNGMLEKTYRVLEADNGQTAVEMIEQGEAIDLIVMDIMMPRLNGFDACHRIRQTHSRENLPIVFVTARKVDEDLAASFAAGGNDFIEKPVSKHKLLPRIEKLLPQSQRA